MKAALRRHPRLVAPLLAAGSLGAIGLLGIWAGIPWLFPSLGPTVALQASSPELPVSRPWNVAGGHLVGLACGLLVVHVTGAASVPGVTEAHALSGVRVGAAVLAVLLSMWVQTALRARHPPAEATTLLIALGALAPDLDTTLAVLGGVLLVTALGESMRRLLGGDGKQPET